MKRARGDDEDNSDDDNSEGEVSWSLEKSPVRKCIVFMAFCQASRWDPKNKQGDGYVLT